LKISLVTMDSGFEMNEEMVDFLESNPELDVQVTSNWALCWKKLHC